MPDEGIVLVGVLLVLLLSCLWQYLGTRVEKIPTYEQAIGIPNREQAQDIDQAENGLQNPPPAYTR
ncbi:hypothetical protein HDV06_002042 [Boothiomyces sp. JEL0866]|nr:hypothetical protein HDV06_002042 [Boothiomyces sp. JEL0866]